MVLAAHLPSDFISAWEDIMVGYSFNYKDPGGQTHSISYTVGNPMGAYSS
jgi:hypothetical protein